ncbi:unnamed protein product [Ambrosiozyma monospora]|uniref:Unnamed protein product n=1 Tax=Ambrosiozyma monospora TaxID=43982 RepID=A0ACB5SR57_AMBMO|nr:unnamed protein product [Ambrosiozyma monospora]
MPEMEQGIILPIRLCSLSWLLSYSLPKIVNIDELHDLKSVWVQINPFELTNNSSRDSNTLSKFDELQQFVSQLPSDLKIFKINWGGYVPVISQSPCGKKKFKTTTTSTTTTTTFNVSVFLPEVELVKFTSPSVLSGCFAEEIRSLDVDLREYKESLSHFLSHFISRLTSLVYLSILLKPHSSADFRKITFPHQLFSLIIEFRQPHVCYIDDGLVENGYKPECVILDTFLIQLNYFDLRFERLKDIIVDGCKGETISSMAEKITVSCGEANWIQSFNFDFDDE